METLPFGFFFKFLKFFIMINKIGYMQVYLSSFLNFALFNINLLNLKKS